MKPSNIKPLPKWGGKRPGAGRKADISARKILLSLPGDCVDELDALAESVGESRNSILKKAIMAYLAKEGKTDE